MSVGKSAVWRPDGTILVHSANTDSSLLIATYRSGTWHGEIVALELGVGART